MNIRSNPRAVAAAKQIEARTGFDVLDESQVEHAIALSARQRARAARQAVISGALAAAIIVALVVANVLGHVDTYALVLAAVLLVINLARMATGSEHLHRWRTAPRVRLRS